MDLARALEWYVQLAQQPGWKDYVWHQTKQLAREHACEFSELPDLLVQRMKALNEDNHHHRDRAQQAAAEQSTAD